jgi:ribosomal protein S18 acetylase RimI-like enzyme
VRLLEELQMNAVPSLQTILYDGWVLRFADGYGNRANSINPVYQSLESVNEKIDNCEMIYRRRNLKPTYKITPFVYPEELDQLLENRGYEIIHPTTVQTLDLSSILEPSIKSIITSSELENQWFEHYCKFNNVNAENGKIYMKMLNNLIPKNFFISLLINSEVIACGMGVIENGFVGIFDIAVSEKHRNNGYGTQLLLNILKVAKEHGSNNAYLQVMLNNIPALHLYNKIGFREEYKYFYRVLFDKSIK